jgi:hypothetical protein
MMDVEAIIGDIMLEDIIVGEGSMVVVEIVGTSVNLDVEISHPVEHDGMLAQTLKEEFEGHSWLYIKSDV